MVSVNIKVNRRDKAHLVTGCNRTRRTNSLTLPKTFQQCEGITGSNKDVTFKLQSGSQHLLLHIEIR